HDARRDAQRGGAGASREAAGAPGSVREHDAGPRARRRGNGRARHQRGRAHALRGRARSLHAGARPLSSRIELPEWEGRAVGAWRSEWRVPALQVFARVSSTNDVLREAATRGAPAGSTVLADLQTAGRGQHGRVWEATPGRSLLMSVLLRTEAAAAPGTAPIRVGLAAAGAIEAVCGIAVDRKSTRLNSSHVK